MLSVIMLNVTYKSFVLNVIMLSVVGLKVVLLSVVTPKLHITVLKHLYNRLLIILGRGNNRCFKVISLY
jgi:hypothetical protein